ncbi:TetR family transcriptional regulator [Actinoplanes ianthinogenes]|uniref:TetR family transcriptional regulator n=1 Tax=Actinoplanes ianthinogenes TaxID=122358 RepID=A0ABM7LJD3_9ACTN|nr:TetR/AcrR family transcriptional regulator [Actinoplanes ianthinogenes]BCJ39362.1 TetR family transcriptional regulator [Actinoplanes ianthinogenes]GGR36629.1 TetR family transcriptional regulator [Actinoplanes ianthinogenes]
MIRSDAARNRAKVLEAAEIVLGERGLAARMDEIARRAGVGVGTVYRHFATKEALYAAIVSARVDDLLESAAGLREPETAFFTFFARIVADAGSKKALTDALRHAGVDVKQGQDDQRARMRATLDRLLRAGQEAGAIRADVAMPEVLALLRGASMAAETGDYTESVLDRSLTVVFDGLRCNHSTNSAVASDRSSRS